MKKILIYSSLFILFSACVTDTTAIEEESIETISTADDDSSEISESQILEKELTEEIGGCGKSQVFVYLDDPDVSGTNIRKSPGGEVVLKLIKDDQNPEFSFHLTEARDNWFKIEDPIFGMEDEFEIPNGIGWVHGSVIGVDTRNYGGEELRLLDAPYDGAVVGVIKKESYGLKIKDLCGDWVKVEHNGMTGWVGSEWLCGNPVTSCS